MDQPLYVIGSIAATIYATVYSYGELSEGVSTPAFQFSTFVSFIQHEKLCVLVIIIISFFFKKKTKQKIFFRKIFFFKKKIDIYEHVLLLFIFIWKINCETIF